MDGLGEILHILNHLSMRRYNEQHDGIETSKIFSENGSVESETRQITNVDVEPWLNQRKPVGEGDDDSGDILRIVWVCRDGINTHSCRYEIKKSNEDRILEQFDVKTIHRLVTDGAFICLPANSAHQSSKQYFALAISGHIAVLVWAHNSTTNTTEAIWWGNNSYMPITVVQKVLEHQKKLARHPMFMALVVAICLSQSIQDLAESIRGTVNRVESRTQHCHLTLRSRAIAQGSYASLSAMMSASATRLGSIGGLIGTLSDILDSISAYHRPQGAQEPEWTETVVTEVNEYVSILRKRQQGQERRISYLTRRAEIQLNTLFNLITQQETRLSISIAQDSRKLASATKDDSTAMKTLTAVTVFFLPGTFVAAFFSMPLFQWDPQTIGRSAMSRQFWVYWAVAAPLTVVTVTLWFAWMRLQMRRRSARDAKEREALDREIDGDSELDINF